MSFEQPLENLITQVGFPIAVCVWLLYEGFRKDNKLTEAINNNTKVLTKVCAKLDIPE